MQDLITRFVEDFLAQVYGESLVAAIAQDSGHTPPLTLLTHAAGRLDKPLFELIEDFGLWLARIEVVRRLLRFSGAAFPDFLAALGELPGRVRLVLPDLTLPDIRVRSDGPARQHLLLGGDDPAWTSLLAGLLRGMADDYGSLALIEVQGMAVCVDVSLDDYAAGRDFSLVARHG
ncbi:MAG: heme NO-binding protein [Paracoccus sp. (in: a-proteobacteria)]|uniref:heme NO-binding protein n=1 Tax=Paracoccus sp. TaxID=267 RepID=UPI0026E077C0|nr:heme NO-binding protein [Paracoccus sp. (in: a-proteobacteria)]MDO5622062.1 heme NO-binding protein [Paracoccus sp. (in: a-proteobacteria)]